MPLQRYWFRLASIHFSIVNTMYTAHILDEESRTMLMLQFMPKYSKVLAHHVTVKFGVPEGTPAPNYADVKLVGYIDSGDGLEALVVSVDGTWIRPDGNIYHITWSLDPDKYSPKDSNTLLSSHLTKWTMMMPTELMTTPGVLQ